MSAEKLPGQFDFLNRLRKERRVVSLYLVSGIRFLGRIVSFDREGLLLDTKHGELLFAQRQISTIGPEIGKVRTPRTHSGNDVRFDEDAQPRDHSSRDPGLRDHGLRDPMRRDSPPRYPGRDLPAREPILREPGSAPAARPAPTVQIIRKTKREIVRDADD